MEVESSSSSFVIRGSCVTEAASAPVSYSIFTSVANGWQILDIPNGAVTRAGLAAAAPDESNREIITTADGRILSLSKSKQLDGT